MTRPYCPRCHSTGQITVVCEDPETSLWYRQTRRCSCVRPVWPWILLVVLALAVGLTPSIVVAFRGVAR